MKGVVGAWFLIGLSWASAQFLNNRPFPTYSLENMPDTGFSCRDKILGGYYADAETQCQMFHICVKVAGVGIQDFRFLCPNGTAFDQDHQICADWEDVDCDATTLYYSSDNFDLYRLGSGFESKAHKYGEDEETFALQRAETGDARLSRNHQTTSVNQEKEQQRYQSPKPKQSNDNNNNNNNNDKEIFKASSSSNFYNNRNNGKERDEDYDDNINVNQNRDFERKRKVIRNKIRRPVQQDNSQDSQNNNYNKKNQGEDNDYSRPQTRRPISRPNNFAGSSYIPTTSRPTTTTINNEQYTTAINNYRLRNGNRQRNYYVNKESSSTPNTAVPNYTISTPAPFRQTQQQYNTPPKRVSSIHFHSPTSTTTQAPTENYPSTEGFDGRYDVPKIKPVEANKANTAIQNKRYEQSTAAYDRTENYPSNNPQYNAFDKKTTAVKQTENYPSTAVVGNSGKPFSNINLPTTFAPRTSSAYSTIAQQTVNYNIVKQSTATKNVPVTQYTPTVPKVTSTTPVSRSNRFDETQYDDGSYSSKYDDGSYHAKYDYDGDRRDDEFLKGAHSQNIAASRNELAKTTNKQQQSQTNKPAFDNPRPFSVSSNTPKAATEIPKTTYNNYNTNQNYNNKPVQNSNVNNNYNKKNNVNNQNYNNKPVQSANNVDYNKNTNNSQNAQKAVEPQKKTKDVSYDYAYYDSNAASLEPEYDIDTEIRKTTTKN